MKVDGPNLIDETTESAKKATKTARSAKKAVKTAKAIKGGLGKTKAGKAAKAAGKAVKGAGKAAAKALGSKPILIAIGAMLVFFIVGDAIIPSSSNNTSGGRTESAQKKDYSEDKEQSKLMEDVQGKIDDIQNKIDNETDEDKITELNKELDSLNNEKDALLRKYTIDKQFEYLAKIMIDEADGAYDEANKKYTDGYNRFANDPEYNTHDNLEGKTIYQDPSSGLFYTRYYVDPKTREIYFKSEDQVEPRGKTFNKNEFKVDDSELTTEEGKVIERAPSTGIAYVIAAYHVSRGGTVPVVHTNGDEKNFAYYETFRDIIKDHKLKDGYYNYTDTLKEKRLRQKVNVFRFTDAVIEELANRDKTDTREVPGWTPVEEEFEYSMYEYHGSIMPYDIKGILEKMFLDDNEFYAEALSTYNSGNTGGYYDGTAEYIGSGFTGSVEDKINMVKASWPEKMDPKRITLIKQAFSATNGQVKYAWGRGHSWSELKNPTQPFMDCSGYVGWAHVMSGVDIGIEPGGAPTAATYFKLKGLKTIRLSDVIPGDMVYSSEHIGIFVGRDSKGRAIYAHSQGSGSEATESNPGKGPSVNQHFTTCRTGLRALTFNDDQTWEGTDGIYRSDESESAARQKEKERIAKENEKLRKEKFNKIYAEIDGMTNSILDPEQNPDAYKDNPKGKLKEEEKKKLEELHGALDDEIKPRDDSVSGQHTGYKLSTEELQEIADMCYAEQSTKQGVAAQASMYISLYEAQAMKNGEEVSPNDLITFIRSKGSLGDSAGSAGNAPEEMRKIVQSVVVNGKRGVKSYVNKYVPSSRIKSAKNDGVSVGPSEYKKDVTIIEMEDGTTFRYNETHGDLVMGYTSRTGREENEVDYFDYENQDVNDALNTNEYGENTNTQYLAGSALEYIMNSPYYEWHIYYNHNCDHEPSMEYLCPECIKEGKSEEEAKPKTYTRGFLFWKKEYTDYFFDKSELPDTVKSTTINENGETVDNEDDVVVVKRKIQMLADEMRNSVEKDERPEEDQATVQPNQESNLTRIVLKYDAGGFDIDDFLLQQGIGGTYSGDYGDFISGADMDGRLGSEDLIKIAESYIGQKAATTVKPYFNRSERWHWCAGFVTMCADKAGLTDMNTSAYSPRFGEKGSMPRHFVTRDGARAFLREKRLRMAIEGYIPKPGDIVYMCTSKDLGYQGYGKGIEVITHVGIVTGYANGKVYTIEGNTTGPGQPEYTNSDESVVARKERNMSMIVCFGIPKYKTGLYGGPLTQSSVNGKVAEFLIRQGFSDPVIAAIMANLMAEAGVDKDGQIAYKSIEKGSGKGIGLCQWTNVRRTQFESYLSMKGYNLETAPIGVHLEFLKMELDKKNNWLTTRLSDHEEYALHAKGKNWKMTYDEFLRLQDPEIATIAFCAQFERPGIPHIDRRIANARKINELIAKVRRESRESGKNTVVEQD